MSYNEVVADKNKDGSESVNQKVSNSQFWCYFDEI